MCVGMYTHMHASLSLSLSLRLCYMHAAIYIVGLASLLHIVHAGVEGRGILVYEAHMYTLLLETRCARRL